MNDLITPGLVSLGVYAGTKLVDNLLERRRSSRAATRDDEASALAQVQAVWAELRQLKDDHEEEIKSLREEHAAKITDLKTLIELHKHQTQRAEARAMKAEAERDKLLAEIAPLKTELDQLRQRVKELEEATHG